MTTKQPTKRAERPPKQPVSWPVPWGMASGEGWSTRRIADKLQVDDKTVRNDLAIGAEYSAPCTRVQTLQAEEATDGKA